jgi:SAM-dependent methyltransferase
MRQRSTRDPAAASMSERRGLWSPLANPWIYEAFQHIVGARRWLRNFAEHVISPPAGALVLDVGCGPAALLRYLPDVRYIGFDRNKAYIDSAAAKYGERGVFICGDVADFASFNLPRVDVAVAIGILHHLDDALATDMLRAIYQTLKPGGRLIVADPCYHPEQNSLQRLIVSRDRGMHVRAFNEYVALCSRSFTQVFATYSRGYSPMPYSICTVESQRTLSEIP